MQPARTSAPKEELIVQSMFDKIAARYDLLNALLSFQQDKRWRKKLMSWLPKRQNGTILDVACGTGDILDQVLKQRADYQELVGVDISQQMLNLADKKLSSSLKKTPKNFVLLRQMSAEELDFPTAKFDAVTISFGLRNVHDKEKALREFFRVLKPKSSLFILEFFPSSSGLMNAVFQLYFHHILPFIGGLLSDKQAYSYLPRSVEGFYSLSELESLLGKIGFQRSRKKVFLWGSCILLEVVK